MRVLRHRLVTCCAALVMLAVAVAVAAWIWLAGWVPGQGKAKLEAWLTQRLQRPVAIAWLNYTPWQGIVIDGLTVTDPATSAVWIRADRILARVALLPLAFQRRAIFRLRADVAVPCRAELDLTGVYDLRGRAALADLRSSAIAIEQLGPPLARFRPPALRSGAVRLAWRIGWSPDAAATINGQTIGTALVWEQGSVRLATDLTVDGTVVLPRAPAAAPRVELTGRVSDGRLSGLPIAGDATALAGTLRLTDDMLTVTDLRGVSLGSPWQVDGDITRANGQAQLRWRGRVDLAQLAGGWPPAAEPWKPEGAVAIVAVYRGTFANWPAAELMADGVVDDASCTLPGLPERLKHIAGRLRFDHLTRRLEIAELQARAFGDPVQARGTVQLTDPARVALLIEADSDLAHAAALLPAGGPVRGATGRAAVRVELTGTSREPAWSGSVALRDATLDLPALPHRVEQINGRLTVTPAEIATDELSLVAEYQPVTITGTVGHYLGTPRVRGRIRAGQARATVAGVLQPDRFTLEESEVSVVSSTLRAQGEIARLASQPSRLTMSGRIAAADLRHVPWIDVAPLDDWGLTGEADVQLRLTGRPGDWRNAVVGGALRAERLSLKGVPIQHVSAEIEQQQQTLAIRVPDGLIAGGRFSGNGSFSYTPPSPTVIEFDVTRADLALLTAAVPALKERHIRGDVSAHVSVMGAWQQPKTLRGDAWAHAAGEHLAELPLLDTLLRGFFGVLADRLGFAGLRKAEITEIAGRFQLAEGRVTTQDFRLTGRSADEPLTIDVRGSVGLDRSLDLIVEPDLSERLVVESPNTSTLSRTILRTVGGLERLRRLVGRHHLGGTIEKPHYKFEMSLEELLKQAIPLGFGQLLGPLQDAQ